MVKLQLIGTNWPFLIAGTSVVLLVTALFIALMAVRSHQISHGLRNPLLYERDFIDRHPPSETFDVLRNTASSMGAKIESIDAEREFIARAPMSGRSWGQFLKVSLVGESDGAYRWKCSSWPTWGTTLWDWGAGRATCEKFLIQLKKLEPSIEELEQIRK